MPSARLIKSLHYREAQEIASAGGGILHPRSISPDRLAIECVDLMERTPKVMQLLVVDGDAKLIGALHLHDLFRARVL